MSRTWIHSVIHLYKHITCCHIFCDQVTATQARACLALVVRALGQRVSEGRSGRRQHKVLILLKAAEKGAPMSISWKGTMSVMAIAICRAPAPSLLAHAAAQRRPAHTPSSPGARLGQPLRLVRRRRAGISTPPEAKQGRQQAGPASRRCRHAPATWTRQDHAPYMRPPDQPGTCRHAVTARHAATEPMLRSRAGPPLQPTLH